MGKKQADKKTQQSRGHQIMQSGKERHKMTRRKEQGILLTDVRKLSMAF